MKKIKKADIDGLRMRIAKRIESGEIESPDGTVNLRGIFSRVEILATAGAPLIMLVSGEEAHNVVELLAGLAVSGKFDASPEAVAEVVEAENAATETAPEPVDEVHPSAKSPKSSKSRHEQ